MRPVALGTLDANDLGGLLEAHRPGFLATLGRQFAEGLADTTPAVLGRELLMGPRADFSAAGELRTGLDPRHAEERRAADEAAGLRAMTEAEWRASPAFRPDLDFDPWATPERAAERAAIHDARWLRQARIAQRRGGVVEGVIGFLAGMAGNVPDPINLVPFIGPAWKAAVAAKAATRSAYIARAAGLATAENAIGTAAVLPLLVPSLAYVGDDTSFAEAVLDVAIGSAIGAGIGSGGAWWSTRGGRGWKLAGNRSPEAPPVFEPVSLDDMIRARGLDQPIPERLPADPIALAREVETINAAALDLAMHQPVEVGGLAPRLPTGGIQTVSVAENLRRGRAAATRVLDGQSDVPAAMYRSDLGEITFNFGAPGRADKAYRGGSGLSHIRAKRTAVDGIDGDAFVRERLPEVLAQGRLERLYGPGTARRADIVLGGDKVVLSLFRRESGRNRRETWVITGFEHRPGGGSDGAGGVTPRSPYTPPNPDIGATAGAEPPPGTMPPDGEGGGSAGGPSPSGAGPVRPTQPADYARSAAPERQQNPAASNVGGADRPVDPEDPRFAPWDASPGRPPADPDQDVRDTLAEPDRDPLAAAVEKVKKLAGARQRRERPPADRPAEALPATDRAFGPDGLVVDVAFEVVDAATLTTSNLDDLTVNPAFPAELQPRDRSRAASGEQIQRLAANLEPALLGRSATVADGAPIVGPDGVVESGNGRVMAIRRAYGQGLDSAAGYRAWLEGQGFDLAGMTAPVLIRRRTTDMSPAERQAFTRAANERSTASLSAAEQARSDAGQLDADLLGLLRSPDVGAAANRPFVRQFLGRIAGEAELGSLVDKSGALSLDGKRRIRGALLARAYDDMPTVERLLEEDDAGLGPLGRALLDTAPEWAKLADPDSTAALMDAVRAVARQRDDGQALHDPLRQGDMLGGGLSADAQAFLASFLAFGRTGNSRLKGRDRLREALGDYLEEVGKRGEGVDLLGQAPARPGEILNALAARRGAEAFEPLDLGSDIDVDQFAAARSAGRVSEAAARAFDDAEAEIERLAALGDTYEAAAFCFTRNA